VNRSLHCEEIMPQLRIWLDDEPEAPARATRFQAADGWVHCRWPEQVIEHLKTGNVAEVSLDHDLGDTPDSVPTKQRSGYDVVAWLEQEVGCGRWSHPLPCIRVHSQNPVGRGKIEACVRNIQQLWEQNQPR